MHGVQFHCLPCHKDPCGDHGARASHHRNKPFSRRQDDLASPALAYVVDCVERQLKQLEGCINSTFAPGTGDVRHSMVRFAAAKERALGALQALLLRPGSGDGANRPLHEYPACSWACFWWSSSQA